jgi:hypothetical protein
MQTAHGMADTTARHAGGFIMISPAAQDEMCLVVVLASRSLWNIQQ